MSSRKPLSVLVVLVALLVCGGSVVAPAEAANWNVAGGGDWSIAGNWTGGATQPPNGIDEIASVLVLQNVAAEGGPTFGFMDVYSAVPEPATLMLLAMGGIAAIRRRK